MRPASPDLVEDGAGAELLVDPPDPDPDSELLVDEGDELLVEDAIWKNH